MVLRVLLVGLLMMSSSLAAELPDPFMSISGERIKSAAEWPARRAEILKIVMEHEYGPLPPAPTNVSVVQLLQHTHKGTNATHRQLKVTCEPTKIGFIIDLIVPEGDGPFPVILSGDWCWSRMNDELRGLIVGRGYILAEFNRLEFAADRTKEPAGLYAAYPDREFGAITAWAWGFHRSVDALITLPYVDKTQIAVTGHSRGGKAALLAGATDERIALTNPNNSGCGGAGCYRFAGEKAETLEMITRNFPTWFSPKLREYAGKENELPFDQHFVKALCAPRALLTTEALDDVHANPTGTLQTHRAAREVYKFLGQPDRIAVYYRPGIHEQNEYDYTVLLDFADQVFKDKASRRQWDQDPFGDLPAAFQWSAPTPAPQPQPPG